MPMTGTTKTRTTTLDEFSGLENTTTVAGDVSFAEKDTRLDDMSDATEQFVTELVENANNAQSSETYKNYLDSIGKLHNYSRRNRLLIHLQKPDATYVAGYNTWQDDFDTHVKGGENALYIRYPVEGTKCPDCGNAPSYTNHDNCDAPEDTDEWGEGILYFGTGSVFDVSQTEMETLPHDMEFATYGENGDDAFTMLMEAANNLDIPVQVADTLPGTRKGDYSPMDDSIRVLDRENTADMASTLAHELAHGVLHGLKEATSDGEAEKIGELEAESVAYVVSKLLGLDPENSKFYLANWGGDDVETVLERLDQVNNAVDKITEAIPAKSE